MNTRMRVLLGAAATDPSGIRAPTPSELSSDIRCGFEEFQGCVLWKDSKRQQFTIEDGEDETGVECLINKTHIDSEDTPELALRQGLGYVFDLEGALRSSGLAGPFRIILAADLASEFPSVTIRHHRLRVGQTWLKEDLETYDEAILVLDLI